MSVATLSPPDSVPAYAAVSDQRLDLLGIEWHQYETIADALPDCRGVRMVYLDGRLIFITTSRRHDWIGERLSQIVIAIARQCRIPWEDSGQATYRLESLKAGVEGDKTFYFGTHARSMKGSKNIDLKTRPAPDLAIEVEVSHDADVAVSSWGRLGVSEVWRYRADNDTITFWSRNPDGAYSPIDTSSCLPGLRPEAVAEQVVLAESLGASDWFDGFHRWVANTFPARPIEGG